jgi:poly(A) polymerase/tRNA nucleotidyltransferase (CCA-adding enzyme)
MVQTNPIPKESIPNIILDNLRQLTAAGYEAYLVGGCTRDILLGRKPKDWDITTNAIPEQIQVVFADSFYENDYGTVGVVNDRLGELDESMRVVEVTPYRKEAGYTDARHPDSVSFSTDIEDDLKRRDFTINAIAYDPIRDVLVDPYGGLKDIQSRTLRTVGEPDERLTEDGLRIMRAIRLAADLEFVISKETEGSLTKNASVLEKIASERIRDEFIKICLSKNGSMALFIAQRTQILKYILPELEEGLHMKQNQAHSFEVFEHLLRSFQCAIDKEYSLEVRIAALLHDIGKPRSRRHSEEKNDYTFYGHEVIGGKMAKTILERLKFSRVTIENVTKLVRWHMFFSDTNQITHSAVRRIVANVGKEHIWDLMNLRVCDRVGTGRPKEDPYRLRKYVAMIEEVLRDPITVGMLKIDGAGIMSTLNMPAGPKIGFMLNILLEEVLEEPELNTSEHLVSRVTELNTLDIKVLKSMSDRAKELALEVDQTKIDEINTKYRVK